MGTTRMGDMGWALPAEPWSKNMFGLGHVLGYVSQCWALDETDVVGVCIRVCIGGVKHAPVHELLTPNSWKDPKTTVRDPFLHS